MSAKGFGFDQRLPVIFQTAAAECGLACLTMIANYHGLRVDLNNVRQRFAVSLRGTTLAHLLRFSGSIGFAGRPLRVELEDLRFLQTPCILHWDMEHFVVLRSATKRTVVVHDPARGKLRMTYQVTSRHFTGIALELTPTASFRPGDQKAMFGLRELSAGVVGLGRSLGKLLFLAFLLELIFLVSPLFLQFAVDQVITPHHPGLLTILGLGFASIVFLQTLLGWARGWIALYCGTALKLQWYNNIFSHLVKLPVSFFETRYFGDIMSRFDGAETVHRTLTNSFVETMLDGIVSIFVLGVMAVYSPAMALIVLASVALYILLRNFAYSPLRGLTEEQLIRMARQQTFIIETLRGIRTIKVFGREEQRRSRWLNLVADNINSQISTEKLSLLLKSVNTLLFGLQAVAVIWVGANRVLSGILTIGMLFAFVAYQQLFTSRVSALIDRVFELRMLSLQVQRLADIALERPETREQLPGQDLSEDATIQIQDLSFRYSDTEPWLLNNVQLSVESGECVAITGPSGAGKSTLLKLMAGLLQPQKGRILVGGQSLAQGRGTIAGKLGFVLQDDTLFGGTITENIAFIADVPDSARVERCARLVCLHDEIQRMPMRYSTLIGDMGNALSGGQQQRLLLARALYAEPSILILDEATSHLDIATEKAITEMLATMNITRVFAAHRPETIAIASRIIALEDLTPIANTDEIPVATCGSEFGSHADPKIEEKGEVYVDQ